MARERPNTLMNRFYSTAAEAFVLQSFPQATSNKNYVTSEFGDLKRVILHFHSHSCRVSVKESTKAVFDGAA